MITLNVIGLNETIARLEKLANEELKKELSAILETGAQQFVRNAKRDAPVNFGVLRNEISYAKINDLTFECVSGASYSPYMEWGTITKFQKPADMDEAEYAALFKGKGIRKTGGITPRRFFFKQTPLVEKYLNNAITDYLNRIKI